MIDIYDLTNFNYTDEPLYTVNINENMQIYQKYDKIYKRLFDEDIGIKTIVLINQDKKHDTTLLYKKDNLNNIKASNLMVETNVPININPYNYHINTIYGNYTIKIYPLNYKYDTNLRCTSYLDLGRGELSRYCIFDIKFMGDIKYMATYMIDIISITNSMPDKKEIYIKDYIHKEEDLIVCFKVFKLNQESFRMYIHYIIFDETKIYFNKFSQDNKFIRRMSIDEISKSFICKNIYIHNLKFPLVNNNDIGKYEICYHFNHID